MDNRTRPLKNDGIFEDNLNNPFSLDFDWESLNDDFDIIPCEKFKEQNSSDDCKINSDLYDVEFY